MSGFIHEHVGQMDHSRYLATGFHPPSSPGPLTSLQAAALAFAVHLRRISKVPDSIFDNLSEELQKIVADEKCTVEKVQDLLVETAAVVSTYNMVSRFLVSLDVAGKSDEPVPGLSIVKRYLHRLRSVYPKLNKLILLP